MEASEMTVGRYAELVDTYIREHWPGGYPGEKLAECLQLDGDEDCQARECGTFTGVPQKVEYCANCKVWHDLRREAEALYGRSL